MHGTTKRVAAAGVAALVTIGAVVGAAQARQQGGAPDLGQMLMQGLMETEGCLGVDAASMESGKASILAWFEDAEAARRWYWSETHKRVMMGMGGGDRKPLEHAPEGVPLLVIATITPSTTPEIAGFPAPISQVSIEIFRAVPGGAFVNGRLSPEAFEVEHMRDFTERQE